MIGDHAAYHKSSFNGSAAAVYKNLAIKGDQKGHFMKNYGALIEIDIQNTLEASYDAFIKKENISNHQFILLDFSNIVDFKWYWRWITTKFDLVETIRCQTNVRDQTTLSLINSLSASLLTSNQPIIYFVDRYISLQPNRIWFRWRANPEDIVIDRNGNIEKLSQVIL